MTLNLFTALLCVLAALRLILYTRSGATHRPWASLLAYLLIIAFAGTAVTLLLGRAPVSWPQFVLNLIFTGAVLSTRGNVVELFRPSGGNTHPLILRILRREKWI